MNQGFSLKVYSRLSFIPILLAFLNFQILNAETPAYKDITLSPKERAADLIGRLTLEEKVSLMMDNSPAIERLGIPKYNWWNEALHGVGRAGVATVFPQSIGMAATFDPEAVEESFSIISDEARAKYNYFRKRGENDRYKGLTFWTPNVNIFRDPRWGRGQETYGEDPYLTSVMGVSVVKGLQGDSLSGHLKTIACAKHFAVHSGPEWNRHTYDASNIFAEDLWSTYLPAFEALVDAGVGQVMCAYNRFEGEPCCANARLLTKILREEWGYDGIVVTDCWAMNDFFQPGHHETHADAVEASADAVMSGTDLECGPVFENLVEAVRNGLIEETKIDKSLMRLLTTRFALGEMDENNNEWSDLSTDIIYSPSHRNKSLEMARKSMTLLKNNGILPLSKDNSSIVVMGPNAVDSLMQLGNYNGTPASTVTILQGIKSKIPGVEYYKGCDLVVENNTGSVFDRIFNNEGKGMVGFYWNNTIPGEETPSNVQIYTFPLNFNTGGATVFAPNVELENFSSIFSGIFKPSETAEYTLLVKKDKDSRLILEINGEAVVLNDNSAKDCEYYDFLAEKGKDYNISLTYIHHEGLANLSFDIIKDLKEEQTPQDYETVIFVGGITPGFEGEEMPVDFPGFHGGDRTSIELPALQRNFLRQLKEQGKKIVFVNCSGSAIALTPEDSLCDAILQAWYPGQDGGLAVADVLFGDYNPAGRLPVTFYKSDSQLPDFEDYDMEGRTYRYMKEKPLYPFGYGLSYSNFEYSNPEVSLSDSDNNSHIFKVNVKNTGEKDGEEVAQLYIKKSDEQGGPQKTLRAFKRVNIPAGETMEVTFHLTPESFYTFDRKSERMKTLPGEYKIFYGGNSATEDFVTVVLD